MKDSLPEYLEADLNEVFKDHVYCNVKEQRLDDYTCKLMTLGFQSQVKPMPCAEFIKWIGLPDYAYGDLGRGFIVYVCNAPEYDGWVNMFDIEDGCVNNFGTAAFNSKFCADEQGKCTRYIYEVADKYPESKIAKELGQKE